MNKDLVAINIDKLTLAYTGTNPVLESVSCKIKHLSYVGLIGPNGGGKTTLLKALLGLLVPLSGSISIFNQPPKKAISSIGYVPQFPLFDKTYPIVVEDVVLMGCLKKPFYHFYGMYKSKNIKKEIVCEALDSVDLVDKRKSQIGQLSGGELQRVLLARALVSKPKMLLLDEPTASIDSHVEKNFYRLLEKLNKTMTIILVSHDIGVISKNVSDIVCINRNLTMHDANTITRKNLTDFYDNPVKCIDHHCGL